MLSEKEKNEISDFFTNGKTIDELSKKFNCTKLTISRNLKKILGEKKYNELIICAKTSNKSHENKESTHSIINKKENQFGKSGHTN